MKVKHIKLAIASGLLLLSSQFTLAQKFELVWGKETKLKNIGSTLWNVIFADENNYKVIFGPTFRNNNPKYQATFLLSNSINHAEEFSFELPAKDKETEFNIRKNFYIDGKLLSFVEAKDKKAKSLSLYCLTIDKSGKIIDKKLMTEMPYQHSFNGQIYKSGEITIKYLKERKQFLVVNNLTLEEKEFDELNFKLYDEGLNLTMNKVIKLPYNNSKFNWIGYELDESNNIYIQGDLIVDKNTVRKTLLTYKKDAQKPIETPVNFGRANGLSNIKFSLNNGSLNFIGFYHGPKEGLSGICVSKIDASTLKQTVEKLIPFSSDDILKLVSEKNLAKDGGLKPTFKINQVIEKDNGEIYVLAESYKSKTTHIDRGEYYTVITCGDIMVVKLSKTNEIDWVSKVSKEQTSDDINDVYLSYEMMMDEANMYLIYNDHIKNSNEKNGEWGDKTIELASYDSKIVITSATVNLSNGALTREVIYNPKEKDKNTFIPTKSFELNKKQLLTFGQRGTMFKFGILTLQ